MGLSVVSDGLNSDGKVKSDIVGVDDEIVGEISLKEVLILEAQQDLFIELNFAIAGSPDKL